MGLFTRRRKLPAERRPALDREERVLAWAAVADGDAAGAGGSAWAAVADGDAAGARTVVATNLGLWLPDGPAGAGAGRYGWHEINKAVWSGRDLAVTPAGVVGERDGYRITVDQPVLAYPLADPGELPNQVRVRVTRSVAYSAHHQFTDGGGVWVVARRVPGVDGLTWTVRYDPGTPVDDLAIVAATDGLVTSARDTATAPD